MWKWTLNWSRVTPSIIIGSCPRQPQDLVKIYNELKITSLLSLQHDECIKNWEIDIEHIYSTSKDMGIVMLRSPMRDYDAVDQQDKLPRAIFALTTLQESGHVTYIHCTAGIGRAPLTVLGYLVLVNCIKVSDALELISEKRPQVRPYIEAFQGCKAHLIQKYDEEIRERAYNLYLAGANSNPVLDWYQAQSEILSEIFKVGYANNNPSVFLELQFNNRKFVL